MGAKGHLEVVDFSQKFPNNMDSLLEKMQSKEHLVSVWVCVTNIFCAKILVKTWLNKKRARNGNTTLLWTFFFAT